MPWKKNIKLTTEALILPQDAENRDTRSVYGDNHAATEDVMLAAHAKCMREKGQIDKQMVAELSKSRRNLNEVTVNYTRGYLAKNPNYTGQDHDEMPTLEVALQRQKARDDAMLKLLRDFRAGKVDENGRPIDGRYGYSPSILSQEDETLSAASSNESSTLLEKQMGDNSMSRNDESSGDNTVTVDSSSGTSSQQSPARKKSNVEQSTDEHQSAPIRTETSPKKRKPSIQTSSQVPPSTSIFPNPTFPESTGATSLTAIMISSSSSSSQSSASSRCRKKRIVPPLPPLPGQPSYAEIGYYQLAALCRHRNIPSSGNEQEVRNTLIRDDTNMLQGLPRERGKGKWRSRKYKHEAPAKLGVQMVSEEQSDPDETIKAENSEGVVR